MHATLPVSAWHPYHLASGCSDMQIDQAGDGLPCPKHPERQQPICAALDLRSHHVSRFMPLADFIRLLKRQPFRGIFHSSTPVSWATRTIGRESSATSTTTSTLRSPIRLSSLLRKRTLLANDGLVCVVAGRTKRSMSPPRLRSSTREPKS